LVLLLSGLSLRIGRQGLQRSVGVKLLQMLVKALDRER
jgi:hypothetical protein